MQCIHINIRQATFVLLTFLANNIQSGRTHPHILISTKQNVDFQLITR